MATFNEIQVGRFNRFLQKLLSMKGDAVMATLNPELQAQLTLLNGVENRYLEGWDRFGIVQTVNAVATFQSSVRVRNPTGSNVLATFEKITGTQGTAGNLQELSVGVAGDLATIVTPINVFFDKRGRAAPSLIVSSDASGSSGSLNVIHRINVGASAPYDYQQNEDQEIPLLPGSCIQLSSAVNSQIIATFWWRERFLEDSERS